MKKDENEDFYHYFQPVPLRSSVVMEHNFAILGYFKKPRFRIKGRNKSALGLI